MFPFTLITESILSANFIIITAHKSPDGDSVGSSLGLYQYIKKLGKEVVICHPDPAPSFLMWMEGIENILTMQNQAEQIAQHFAKADLVFCLDYNSPERIGEEMQKLLVDSPAKKIMIDHHLDPADFTQISISDTSSSSTAQLIAEVVLNGPYRHLLDEQTGTPLYLGILTDTGSFRFPSVTPKTHDILSKLIASGVKHYQIHEQLNDNNTFEKLKLQGYAMSNNLEVLNEYKVAIISLSAEDLENHKFQKGDTDGLVNMALSIKGIKAAMFFSEKDGMIKISFRSKGQENPVNVLAAEHFEGGGHANASGGVSHLSMPETLEKIKKLIPNYFPKEK
jgi:phosphoesterase RecJ-like protein